MTSKRFFSGRQVIEFLEKMQKLCLNERNLINLVIEKESKEKQT